MEFYIITWFVFFFLSSSGLFGAARPSIRPMVMIILLLAFFVAFRENVGSDWGSYRNYYYTGVAEDKSSGEMEPGFGFIRFLCYSLGLSHALFFYVLSCISLFAIYRASILLRVPNIYVSFFVYLALFFCSFQFNIVRNGLVASLVWLAYAYKTNGMNLKALICILIAGSIHIVGLVFIPVMFFIDKKWSKRFVVISLCLAFVLFLLNFSSRLLGAFPILALIDRVEAAVDPDRAVGYGLSLGLIFNIVLFLYCFFIAHKRYENSLVHRVLSNAIFLSVVIGLIFNSFSLVVARVGQTLNLSLVFLWPHLLYGIRRQRLKLIVGCCLIVYLALYFYKPLIEDPHKDVSANLIPYRINPGQLFETSL